MTRFFLAGLVSVAFALSGCGDDKPSEKISSERVRAIADSDALEGLEVADFARENGWIDNDAPNRYKVRYAYKLRLAKPYGEVVLANARNLQGEYEGSYKNKNQGTLDLHDMQSTLEIIQLNIAVNRWIQDQGDAFTKRRDDFLNACAPCLAYWNSDDAPKEATLRRQSFVSSWVYLESIGFKDNFNVGDSVPRTAWAAFINTEKGWKPVE